MEHQLDDLWRSTAGLYRRFFRDGVADFDSVRRVMFEEFGEFVAAVYVDADMEDSVAEAADLFVTILAMVQWMGFSLDQLKAAMHAVCLKNDAKTPDTHYVDRHGKIVRLPPPVEEDLIVEFVDDTENAEQEGI